MKLAIGPLGRPLAVRSLAGLASFASLAQRRPPQKTGPTAAAQARPKLALERAAALPTTAVPQQAEEAMDPEAATEAASAREPPAEAV